MATILAPALRLSHFASMALFAFLISIALACVAPERSGAQRVKYAAVTFLLFLVVAICVAWLMYLFSR